MPLFISLETDRMVCFVVTAEAKLAVFWTLILDEKKPLFTTEKFLSQASEEGEAETNNTQICQQSVITQASKYGMTLSSKPGFFHPSSVHSDTAV